MTDRDVRETIYLCDKKERGRYILDRNRVTCDISTVSVNIQTQ